MINQTISSSEVSQNKLLMKIDNNIIEHLGIKMYRSLPPVLAELISNAYDADADNVMIEFIDTDIERQIIITDDGDGMDFDEINQNFLIIGKNRRKESGERTKKGRFVTGRKGIGKLAIFGVANEIHIETRKNNIETIFILNLDDILNSSDKNYEPKFTLEQKNNLPSGTKIVLKEIKKMKENSIDDLSENISMRFNFGDTNFKIKLKMEEAEEEIDSDTKWKYFKAKHTWTFPNDDKSKDNFASKNEITGKVVMNESGLNENQRGLFLFARGKMVNSNEFYGLKGPASSYIYNNLTGCLNVDFVDNFPDDYVMTNRAGLIWDKAELSPLREWIRATLVSIEKQGRQIREENKILKFVEITGKNPQEWVDNLPRNERKLAEKIVKNIITEETINEEKASTLIEYVQQSFEFEAFKDFAAEIDESGLDEIKLLDLFKEWQVIEAREFYKLSIGRIEAIRKLQKFVDTNAKEVPTVHNFLKEFPWLLDPRLTIEKDECRYSDLLKEKYPDSKLPEENRRLDFLCTGMGDTLYVVELKRPSCRVSHEEMDQVIEYCGFLENHYLGTSDSSYRHVAGYLIAGGRVNSNGIDKKILAYENSRIYLKTYFDLLTQAENYHQEFLDKYKKFEGNKNKA